MEENTRREQKQLEKMNIIKKGIYQVKKLPENSWKKKIIFTVLAMCIGAILGCIIGAIKVAVTPATKESKEHLTIEENIPVDEGQTSESDMGLTREDAVVPAGATAVKTVNLLAVGDNLIHSGIFKSGYQADGIYNFDHLYENVIEDIQAADLAFVNQETIYTYNRNDYSGYPMFAGPVEIGDALVDAGFDVVTHATNHAYDRGTQGIADTLDFWETNHPEMTVLGMHDSQVDADIIETVECNGITFAMLNYTYSLNGLQLPGDQQYLVDILDKEKVQADIEEAKSISDCVIFFLHCGNEYVYEPADYTKEWVQFLLDCGVDITIASHPHVLEPYTELTRDDGHRMIVYYSMGNFISTQDDYPRMIGGMAKLTVEKRGVGEKAQISVLDYTLEPLYTHYNHDTGVYTVYKLEDYTEELAAGHALYSNYATPITTEVIWDKFEEIMNTPVKQPGHEHTME